MTRHTARGVKGGNARFFKGSVKGMMERNCWHKTKQVGLDIIWTARCGSSYNPITFQLHLLEQKSVHPSSSIIFLPLSWSYNPCPTRLSHRNPIDFSLQKTSCRFGLMGLKEVKVSKPESPASAHMYWKHRVPLVVTEAMFCTSWLMLRTPTAAEKIGQKRRQKREWEVLKREPKAVFLIELLWGSVFVTFTFS